MDHFSYYGLCACESYLFTCLFIHLFCDFIQIESHELFEFLISTRMTLDQKFR